MTDLELGKRTLRDAGHEALLSVRWEPNPMVLQAKAYLDSNIP